MLESLVSPWSCVGAVAGLLVAMVVHWAAPADIDIAQAGAWLVGIGWAAGLAWDLIGSERSKYR
jgi:hypothetical protein